MFCGSFSFVGGLRKSTKRGFVLEVFKANRCSLQACEHYYLLTDTIPGLDLNLPVLEDPSNFAYIRPEGSGMMVGLFEGHAGMSCSAAKFQ